MFCPKCGTQNDDHATQCTSCGQTLHENPPETVTPAASVGTSPYANATAQGNQVPTTIPNYLVQSILSTLCCCLPLGIVAIVFASQVNTKIAAGDIAGAMDSSKKAKMWCWISFGLGITGWILYALLMMVPFLMRAGRY